MLENVGCHCRSSLLPRQALWNWTLRLLQLAAALLARRRSRWCLWRLLQMFPGRKPVRRCMDCLMRSNWPFSCQSLQRRRRRMNCRVQILHMREAVRLVDLRVVALTRVLGLVLGLVV